MSDPTTIGENELRAILPRWVELVDMVIAGPEPDEALELLHRSLSAALHHRKYDLIWGAEQVELVARAIDPDWWAWADKHYWSEAHGDVQQRGYSLARARNALDAVSAFSSLANIDRRKDGLGTVSVKPLEAGEKPEKTDINDEHTILSRLSDGDLITYSQDGDDGWFTEGDRAFVGSVIIELRNKGYLRRFALSEENHRGMDERDTISSKGRERLAALDRAIAAQGEAS